MSPMKTLITFVLATIVRLKQHAHAQRSLYFDHNLPLETTMHRKPSTHINSLELLARIWINQTSLGDWRWENVVGNIARERTWSPLPRRRESD